jgi:ABC-type bacteriocin/lantibiotic exporter with double-glycine peptidase domain
LDSKQPKLSALQRFYRMLRLDRVEIGYIYLYAIFGGIINLTLPLGIQAILNFLQGGKLSSSWWVLILVVTMGTLLAGVLIIMQMTVSETIQRRIFTRVAFDFAARLPMLHTEAIRREHVPELVNRFFDTLTIQKGLPKILIDLSTAAMQIFFGLLLLSFYHPSFIFFGALLVFFLFLILRLTGPTGLQTSLKESKYKYEVAFWLEEVARTLSTFKLAGETNLPLSKTDYHVSHYLDAKKAHFRILIWQYGSIVAFKTGITVILLGLGSYLVLDNQINLGQFVAAELIVLLIISSTEKLIASMDTVYDVLTALEKLGAVTDLTIEKEEGIVFENVTTRGMRVDLQNITYQFADAAKPVLSNLNLSIKAGERLCIAGYNGSGKTTLLQIIARALTQFEGNVLYDNIAAQQFKLSTLRRRIGDYSSQEEVFKGTLYENITLSSGNDLTEKVYAIIEQVGLTDFVHRLSQGLDTMLLPSGKNLPRHIVAKIILARGIFHEPKLLAIEEFFSNLDRRDREKIAELLTNPAQPWTLVAVSDDPILAAQCDRILVMQNGTIIESGTFAEIEKSVHYLKIFKTA